MAGAGVSRVSGGLAQVTVADLDEGIVVITVSAFNLPLGQSYSLAVQGTDPPSPLRAHNAQLHTPVEPRHSHRLMFPASPIVCFDSPCKC